MASIKQLKEFCTDEDTLGLISAPESEMVESRRATSFVPSLRTAWTAILAHLKAPTNGGTVELNSDAVGAYVAVPSMPRLPVSQLLPILPRLQTLKLTAVPLDSPMALFPCARNLLHLDLSGSVDHAEGLFCLQHGWMLHEWRSHPVHAKKVHVLVMDDVSFDPRYVSRVAADAWKKHTGILDFESDTSFTVPLQAAQ